MTSTSLDGLNLFQILYFLTIILGLCLACNPDYADDSSAKTLLANFVFSGEVKSLSKPVNSPLLGDSVYTAGFSVEKFYKGPFTNIALNVGALNDTTWPANTLLYVGYFGPNKAELCMDMVKLGGKYMVYAQTQTFQMNNSAVYKVSQKPDPLGRAVKRLVSKIIKDGAIPPRIRYQTENQIKPPPWPGAPASVIAAPGEALRLKCVVDEARPRPLFRWLFNTLPLFGQKLRHEKIDIYQGNVYERSTLLILRSIKKQQAGNYTCIVANPAGQASITFIVTVDPDRTLPINKSRPTGDRRQYMATPLPLATLVVNDNNSVHTYKPCLDQAYCYNGGICVFNVKDVERKLCLCGKWWSGDKCEYRSPSDDAISRMQTKFDEEVLSIQRQRDRIITIICIIVGLILLAAIFLVAFFKSRQNRLLAETRKAVQAERNQNAAQQPLLSSTPTPAQLELMTSSYPASNGGASYATNTLPLTRKQVDYSGSFMVSNQQTSSPTITNASASTQTPQLHVAPTKVQSVYIQTEEMKPIAKVTSVQEDKTSYDSAVHIDLAAPETDLLGASPDRKMFPNPTYSESYDDYHSYNAVVSNPDHLGHVRDGHQFHRKLPHSERELLTWDGRIQLAKSPVTSPALSAQRAYHGLPDCEIIKGPDGIVIKPQNAALKPNGERPRDDTYILKNRMADGKIPKAVTFNYSADQPRSSKATDSDVIYSSPYQDSYPYSNNYMYDNRGRTLPNPRRSANPPYHGPAS